jgi:predicted GH43/DUF377 family glycosyl hydrolase
MIEVKRLNMQLVADPRRRILKFLNMGNPKRIEPVLNHITTLSTDEVTMQLEEIRTLFGSRHRDLNHAFTDHFTRLKAGMPLEGLTPDAETLLGAYFTHEYTIESAALFNPSIVLHPEQDRLHEGETRFILSLRATGEGHISSIAFQDGYYNAQNDVIRLIERPLQADTGVQKFLSDNKNDGYSVQFPYHLPTGSCVLFPFAPAESNGMEDARFIYLGDEENAYFATYTAYNGSAIHPHLIRTTDFRNFTLKPIRGTAASDKGMAIFPEKIQNRYMMVGRQGGRQLTLMESENLYEWNHFKPLQKPARNWELLQLGNCGSPVKTREGWLLLTHAVGPMRRYVLSITLLDLENPSKVIASLDRPLMEPNEKEREGYVPNVLYTCGMLNLGNTLLIPYAMSDSAIGFATASQDEILNALLKK